MTSKSTFSAPVKATPSGKEAALAHNYAGILDFWTRHGEARSFLGVNKVLITGMSFQRYDTDRAIVISSGRTESFLKYREVIFDLWHAGYSVFIIDHRGQGLSERVLKAPAGAGAQTSRNTYEIGYVDRFDDYVDDLKVFVDQIVKPAGSRHLFILAHSMGGAIASLYLENYPADFEAAVLLSPMHEINLAPVPARACWLVPFLGRPKHYIFGKGPYKELEEFDPKLALTSSQTRYELLWRDELRRTPDARLGGPSTRWVHEACLGAKRSREEANRVTVPVLVLQAGKDTVVNARGQSEFCKGVRNGGSGSCVIERVENARHELLMERDEYRDYALRRALEFLGPLGR
ncbi:alpha/beta fold hydrolase [Rhizobium sp. S163]|uniref:alpha/beta fold hydrolase n=1 Tax=Rhizobium sp. S163 TaxID=3055039 RepID=UPI0025A94C09|nr:alpha/beta fold hydrolase [Rhizobium sp. S163]MDM9648346.1 alpha/beta fold hydrolase [Rhizobium sp. S163]